MYFLSNNTGKQIDQFHSWTFEIKVNWSLSFIAISLVLFKIINKTLFALQNNRYIGVNAYIVIAAREKVIKKDIFIIIPSSDNHELDFTFTISMYCVFYNNCFVSAVKNCDDSSRKSNSSPNIRSIKRSCEQVSPINHSI